MITKKIYMTAASDPGLGKESEGITLSGTQYSRKWANTDGDGYSYHLEWTGTPTADVTLWMSNKDNPSEANDTDWVQDLNFGTAGVLALGGAAGKDGDSSGNAKFRYYRFKSVLGAGAGTIKGWVVAPRLA